MVDTDGFYIQLLLKTLADAVRPLNFKSFVGIRETFLWE